MTDRSPARIAIARHDTPVGEVLLAFTDHGLLSLEVLHDDPRDAIAHLARRTGIAPEPEEAAAAPVRRQLDEYFAGDRRTFEFELDWSLARGFTRAALQAIVEIPYAETAGYGEIAASAGHPRAARAVGTACATSPFSIVVPVHRVVRADGSIGEYGGHPEIKRQLLQLERDAAA